mmetsp:Transcript_26051/g.59399  ORF Transcript_26051/g.59399 Transcript_26051/m.59399 type:complete len:293 (-) Transcript_26051:43-921(-)
MLSLSHWCKVVPPGGEARFKPEEAPILNVTHVSMCSGERVVISAGSGQKQFQVCVLTRAAPNARLDLRFEEEAVFRASGGEACLWGSTQGTAKRARLDDAAPKPAESLLAKEKPTSAPVPKVPKPKPQPKSAPSPKAAPAPKATPTPRAAQSKSTTSLESAGAKTSVRKADATNDASADKKVHTIVKKDLGQGVIGEVLRTGSGQAARPGRRVTVKYEGRLTNGKKFDSGSITFVLGIGQVIRGWDIAVKGMLVGERRKLLIPAPLAYGRAGSPPDIPPNAALTFDITLQKC